MEQPFRFLHHAPGGMSASMAFNMDFAKELSSDFAKDLTENKHHYADNVVAYETMPKFKCFLSKVFTATYLSHMGSTTSSGWVKLKLKPKLI